MLQKLNNYCHGYVTIPAILVCKKRGLFDLLDETPTTWTRIITQLGANDGHLRVVMRMLESIDWLLKDEEGNYRLTSQAHLLHKLPENITEILNISMEVYFKKETQEIDPLKPWIKQSMEGWGIVDPTLRGMLDGLLLIPLLMGIHSANLYDKNQNLLLVNNSGCYLPNELVPLLQKHQWCGPNNRNGFVLTEFVQFCMERVLDIGIVTSYAPMLRQLDRVIFGDCASVFQLNTDGHESYVDQQLNVLSSGFSHRCFFDDIEEIILSVFNQLPLENQPKYVADMGCGDGSLLHKIYIAIKNNSERGKVLDQYPLTMIGIDNNEKALKAAKEMLQGIPSIVILGDIGNPQKLEKDLSQYVEDVKQILHLHSFLDHNRTWNAPENIYALEKRKRIEYQGVFVSPEGKEIEPHVVVQSLVEHFKKWGMIQSQFGLIILEAHCLPTTIVSKFLNDTENLHFDACHSFSGQFLVEAEVFMLAAAEAGFFHKLSFSKKYPNYLPYTRITLNHFERRDYQIRFAVYEDLPVLIQLEHACFPEAIFATACGRWLYSLPHLLRLSAA